MKKIATYNTIKKLVEYLKTDFLAPKAKQLKTPRKISLSGDITGEASFDGSSDVSITVKSSNSNSNVFVPADNAPAHNAIYRGKALGSSVTPEQWEAIKAGTFTDLFIGDYWIINEVNWRIAAFDYWLNCGDTACKTHHAVIVPDTCLAKCKMNDTNVTTGGYVGSDFYTGANSNTGKATAVNAINTAFGSAHILSHREYLTNAVSNGKPAGTGWYDSTVELMNEPMVYGTTFFEQNTNVQEPLTYCSVIDKTQLPLFAHDPGRITNGSIWWLRDIVAATLFAGVGNCGENGCCYAGDIHAIDSIGIRPAFGIYQS